MQDLSRFHKDPAYNPHLFTIDRWRKWREQSRSPRAGGVGGMGNRTGYENMGSAELLDLYYESSGDSLPLRKYQQSIDTIQAGNAQQAQQRASNFGRGFGGGIGGGTSYSLDPKTGSVMRSTTTPRGFGMGGSVTRRDYAGSGRFHMPEEEQLARYGTITRLKGVSDASKQRRAGRMAGRKIIGGMEQLGGALPSGAKDLLMAGASEASVMDMLDQTRAKRLGAGARGPLPPGVGAAAAGVAPAGPPMSAQERRRGAVRGRQQGLFGLKDRIQQAVLESIQSREYTSPADFEKEFRELLVESGAHGLSASEIGELRRAGLAVFEGEPGRTGLAQTEIGALDRERALQEARGSAMPAPPVRGMPVEKPPPGERSLQAEQSADAKAQINSLAGLPLRAAVPEFLQFENELRSGGARIEDINALRNYFINVMAPQDPAELREFRRELHSLGFYGGGPGLPEQAPTGSLALRKFPGTRRLPYRGEAFTEDWDRQFGRGRFYSQ